MSAHPRPGEVEAEGLRFQGHPQLLSELETSLGYMKPSLKKKQNNKNKPYTQQQEKCGLY